MDIILGIIAGVYALAEPESYYLKRWCNMKSMIAIMNKSKGIVSFYNIDQKSDAIKARKSDPLLKYARVINVLQANPSKIEIGKVYTS